MAAMGAGTGATNISAMEGRRSAVVQSRPSATDPEIRLGLFRERGRQRPRAHQGGKPHKKTEHPKENADLKRFSWLECEPLPLPQLREGRGTIPSQGDVIFAVFAALSQCSLSLSDPDNSLVRVGPLPDAR